MKKFDWNADKNQQLIADRGVSFEGFRDWKSRQTITQLGYLFDITEEKNTAQALRELDGVDF